MIVTEVSVSVSSQKPLSYYGVLDEAGRLSGICITHRGWKLNTSLIKCQLGVTVVLLLGMGDLNMT